MESMQTVWVQLSVIPPFLPRKYSYIWQLLYFGDIGDKSKERYNISTPIFKKLFFLTGELSLINTCCWRADREILIRDGASRSELIIVSTRQHMC